MEEVTKCSYINCVDSLEKEQIFHELPVCDIGLCVKWLINSGHEDLVGKDFNTLRSMKFFICNNHFTPDCYLSKGTLKESAVPRPHWNSVLRKREPQARNFSHAPNINMRSTSIEANPNDRSSAAHCDGNIKDVQNGKDTLPNGEYSDQWCRTCAMKKPNLVSMIVKNKKTEMSLLSKLKLLIEIDDEDTLPLNMCWECVRKLEQSFQFFQQIYIADNTLRHIFPVSTSKAHNIRTSTPLKSRSVDDECLDDKNVTNSKVSGSYPTVNRKSWRTPVTEAKSKGPTIKPTIISKSSCLSKTQPSIGQKKVVASIKSTVPNDSTKETVQSLLSDPCFNDEELRWIDVLKIVKQQVHKKNSGSRGHVLSHPEMLISCEFCNAKFKFRKQLKSHLIVEHLRQTNNMCKDCIICYNNKSLLLEHRAIYHNDKRYNCNYCLSDFATKSKLRKHINRLHLDEVYYSCDVCNEKFKTKEHLFEHIETLHLNSWSSNSSSSNSSTGSMSSLDNKSTNSYVIKSKVEIEDQTNENTPCNNVTITPLPNITEQVTTRGITTTTTAPIATVVSTSTACTTSTAPTDTLSTSNNGRFCPECEIPLDETMACSKCSVVAELPIKRCRTEYRCEQCSSFFSDAEAYTAHVETHRIMNTAPVPSSQTQKTGKPPDSGDMCCDQCSIDLCDVNDLRIHQMQCRMIKEKDFTCLICENSSFSSLEDYEKHIDFHCKQLKTPI